MSDWHPSRLSTTEMDRLAEKGLRIVSGHEPYDPETLNRLCRVVIHLTSRMVLARYALGGGE